MYCNPYTDPTVITTDQTTKLTPIKVTTLILEEPNTRAIKAAMSVPSMEGEIKAKTGRPYFSQICLALVSLFVGPVFPFFALLLLRHPAISLKNIAKTITIMKFPKKEIIPTAIGDIPKATPTGII